MRPATDAQESDGAALKSISRENSFVVGAWRIEPSVREACNGPVVRRLSPRALGVLIMLAQADGMAVSRTALLEGVWPDVTVGDDSLTQAIAELRRVLRGCDGTVSLIETVPKSGYRLSHVASIEGQGANIVPPVAASGSLTVPKFAPRANAPSIAVLAFTNMSGDGEQEFFADGISEDIITDLSRFRSLAVIARHSSFSFKGRQVTAQEVGATLGVDFVLEGSLRRAGKMMRINAQLIEASTGHHIWAERYDLDQQRIFELQDSLVQGIVARIRERVEGVSLERANCRGTDSLSAYEHVLRGRAFYDHMSEGGYREAERHFERAIEIDPGYSLAFAHRARILVDDYLFAWAVEPQTLLSQALDLVQRAVALDASDSVVHATLGTVYTYARRYRRAEKALDLAISLNPNDTDALVQRGFLAECLGQRDQSIAWVNKGLELNPYPPEWYLWGLVRALFASRRYAEVVDIVEEMERPPCEVLGLAAASLTRLGDIKRAEQTLSCFHDQAARQMSRYPGPDRADWRRYWSNAFPFKEQDDLDFLLEGLHLAGLTP